MHIFVKWDRILPGVRQTQGAVDAAQIGRRCSRAEYDGINDRAGYKRWSLGKWTWTRASIRGINPKICL